MLYILHEKSRQSSYNCAVIRFQTESMGIEVNILDPLFNNMKVFAVVYKMYISEKAYDEVKNNFLDNTASS